MQLLLNWICRRNILSEHMKIFVPHVSLTAKMKNYLVLLELYVWHKLWSQTTNLHLETRLAGAKYLHLNSSYIWKIQFNVKRHKSSSLHGAFISPSSSFLHREAQQFVDKFEGALGKGKGRKWYAYKVMMTKVRLSIQTVLLCVCVPVFLVSFSVSFFLIISRNGSSSRGILRTSEQPVSPGRGRLKRLKVRFVIGISSWTATPSGQILSFKNLLNVLRSLWVVCGVLLHLPALDVRHEPRPLRLHFWTGGHPWGEMMHSCLVIKYGCQSK